VVQNRRQPKLYNDVAVVDCGAKGEAIAKKDEQVFLVKNVVPGDVINIRTIKGKKGITMAESTAIVQYSSDRIIPTCSHFYYCGGCNWQNLKYEKQLFFKQKWVNDTLTRIGKVDTSTMLPIVGCEQIFYYRNRLDYGFSHQRWFTPTELYDKTKTIDKHQPAIGFHVPGKFDKILDIQHCYLQEDPSNIIRLALGRFAKQHKYEFFDIRRQQGSLRSLIIRTSTTGQVMLIVVFAFETSERIELMMQWLKNSFPVISSLIYVVNKKLNDTLYDQDHIIYSGNEYIEENLLGVSYRIGPKSFFQTNPNQAAVLFKQALDLADIQPHHRVFDLYCGVGSITLLAAKLAKYVLGIETVPEAIDWANKNAELNKLTNVEFIASEVNNQLEQDFIDKYGVPDILITDPPRVGMEPAVIKKLLNIAAPVIIYISCNPGTQARDLQLLSEKYEIVAIQAVDMFPHTYHVENIVKLVLKSI